MGEIAKLFPGCVWLASREKIMIMRVANWDEALKLTNHSLPYLAWIAKVCGKEAIEIVHNTPAPGRPNCIPIAAAMAEEPPSFAIEDYNLCAEEILDSLRYSKNKGNQEEIMMNLEEKSPVLASQLSGLQDSAIASDLTIEEVVEYSRSPEEDFDAELSALLHREKQKAVWIIDQKNQNVLACNRAAITANEKPPKGILNSDISALWDAENLKALTELVDRDGVVKDHTNNGFRWKRWHEEDFDSYTRMRFSFNVDYKKVYYLGREARFEIVKEAIPT